jgi:hypothetical protein
VRITAGGNAVASQGTYIIIKISRHAPQSFVVLAMLIRSVLGSDSYPEARILHNGGFTRVSKPLEH